ncbi:hypothetical protein [Nisaea nitritireducens]|uniref:hypothetical protein n=1 Tax=Nisaea nitritireducens TaxID=568392 RepID=UPI00186762DA|nr:hypothetical protein [Nisaea nitritireducens]
MNETIPSSPELANSLYEEIFMPALSQVTQTSLGDKGALTIGVMASAHARYLPESIGAEHAGQLEKNTKFVS